MKKVVLIIFLLMVLTGCSVVKLDASNYDYLIEHVIMKSKKLKNENFDGFSFYIPRGMNIVSKDDYNVILKDQFHNYYYVYVDVVSFYNHAKNTYQEDHDASFSRKFTSNDGKKSGYLEINEVNSKYFVEALYNYVKIEVYSNEENLSDSVLYVSQILSSIQYNRNVLKTSISQDTLYYKEENFNIFETKKNTNSYLDYIEKYDSGAVNNDNVKGSDLDDDDMIDTDINEE